MKVLQLYRTKQNSLIVQDLWQVYYQILLIISQKELIKIKCKDYDSFVDYENVMGNLIKYKRLP